MNQSALVGFLSVLVIAGFVFFYLNGLFDPPKTQEHFALFEKPLIQPTPTRMYYEQLNNAGLGSCPKGDLGCDPAITAIVKPLDSGSIDATEFVNNRSIDTYETQKKGASSWRDPPVKVNQCIPVPDMEIPLPVSCVKTSLDEMYQLSIPGYTGVTLAPISEPPKTLMPISTFAQLTEAQKQAYAANLTPQQLGILRAQFDFYNATTQNDPKFVVSDTCGFGPKNPNGCGPCPDPTKVCASSGAGTNQCIEQNMVGQTSAFGKPWAKCSNIANAA